MICTLERIPPIGENLLLEAQPASTMPYTESEASVNTYRTPIETSAPISGIARPAAGNVAPYGMTAKVVNAEKTAIAGASRKSILSALEGITPSLKKNLMTSAAG